jgi:hypothetical protein
MKSEALFAYIVLGSLFGTILVVFAMKYFSAAYQARQKAKGDEAYREIAQTAAAAQTETAASLSAMKTDLTAINTRLASVEKILKEVG